MTTIIDHKTDYLQNIQNGKPIKIPSVTAQILPKLEMRTGMPPPGIVLFDHVIDEIEKY